jgi:transposase InsO family protein
VVHARAQHPTAVLTPAGRRRMVACVIVRGWTIEATAQRFHRILLEEWAYIRAWASETERSAGYAGFVHFYNHHRSHGALGWATPAHALARLQDNLPDRHA